jgi:hypothetical protein
MMYSSANQCFFVYFLVDLSVLTYGAHFAFLKVPMREIFDRSDFCDFYTIKSSWVPGDLLVKILTCYFNF